MRSSKIVAGADRDLKYGRMLLRTGQILLIAGPLIVFGIFYLLAVIFPSLEDHVIVSILFCLLFFIALLWSISLALKTMYRGKQYVSRAMAAASNLDIRHPVVYLRPFIADIPEYYKTGGLWPWRFSVEEQLADAVEPIGPLVAIGRPDEQLPTPGAVRQYFKDKEWQNVVREWIAKARIIIVRAGMSEGLLWEFKEAVAAGYAKRLLLLVFNMKKADYLLFSQFIKDQLGIQLLDFNEISRWRRASGFFEFDAAWEVQFLPLRAPWLRTEQYINLKAAFNHTLQPVFLKLGVPWCPSPLAKLKLFAFGTCGFAIVVFTVLYMTS